MPKKILPTKFDDNQLVPTKTSAKRTNIGLQNTNAVVTSRSTNKNTSAALKTNRISSCTNYNLGDNCFSFCSNQDVFVNITENITEQKYIKNIEGVGMPCAGVINSSNVYTNVISNFSKLAFDSTDGFTIFDLGNGTAKVEYNNPVTGVTCLNNLSGPITLSAGNNVSIGATGNTLTICSSGGSVVSPATPTTLGTTYAYNQTSYCNTFVGYCAGNTSSTGTSNIAIGQNALINNITGNNNVAIGNNALYSQPGNSYGYGNIAIGKDALYSNLTGYGNVAIGDCAMYMHNSPYGWGNVGIGYEALKCNTSGLANTAIGYGSMSRGTGNFSNNVSLGTRALKYLSVGCGNVATGADALFGLTSGCYNIAVGPGALQELTNANDNIAIGNHALWLLNNGNNNISIGCLSGCSVTTGNNNTIIGSLTGTAGMVCTVLVGAGTCERIKVDDTGLYINDSGVGSAISYRNVYEQVDQKTGATGVVVHDFSASSIFYHSSIASNFTVNLTNFNMVANKATNVVLILNQGATPYLPTAIQINGIAQTINWQGGSAPTGTANVKDIVSFSIVNLSGTYLVLGQSVAFS